METIGNLIELLKSQLALYKEIKETLSKEKSFIVSWDFTNIPDLVKEKENLFRREKILEEARKSLTDRLVAEYSLEEPTLLSIINASKNKEQKEELTKLREGLSLVAVEISKENTALKLLYSTNIRLINDLYAKIGIMQTSNKYGMDKSKNQAQAVSTFSAAG